MSPKPRRFLITAIALGLTACVQQTAEISSTVDDAAVDAASSSYTQFPDIPSPPGSKILVERTLVLGSGDTWTGQMVMRTPKGPFAMFDFFKQKLPEFGWSEITSVRAPTSVLTYVRDARIASIQITSATLQGSEITVTVSPRDARQGYAPVSGGMAPEAAASAPPSARR